MKKKKKKKEKLKTTNTCMYRVLPILYIGNLVWKNGFLGESRWKFLCDEAPTHWTHLSAVISPWNYNRRCKCTVLFGNRVVSLQFSNTADIIWWKPLPRARKISCFCNVCRLRIKFIIFSPADFSIGHLWAPTLKQQYLHYCQFFFRLVLLLLYYPCSLFISRRCVFLCLWNNQAYKLV